jgi:hypothetical protein
MINELPQSKDPVLGFEVTGKVSLEEEQKLISRVEETLKEHDKVSALVVLGEEASWGVKAGITDLKWLLTHMDDLDRIAIVSDSKVWEWLIKIDSKFAKMAGIKEKHFETDDLDDAWEFVQGH